jgi:hypothetical protein
MHWQHQHSPSLKLADSSASCFRMSNFDLPVAIDEHLQIFDTCFAPQGTFFEIFIFL